MSQHSKAVEKIRMTEAAHTRARKRFGEPVIEPEALPCPFCGAMADIQYWHGGKPTKRRIACSGQGDTLKGNSDRNSTEPSKGDQ